MNPPHEPHRQHFVVSGRVQGVGFRAATRTQAERLGVRGFVRNQSDGSVEAEAEGDAATLAKFAAWLQRGPMFARVDRVTTSERSVLADEHGFEIRY